jgi:hypothetical protein
MNHNMWIRGAALITSVLVAACATPPAQIDTVSSRTSRYDRPLKRVVVVVGGLGVLDSRVVRSQLSDELKANQVRALVLQHDPLLMPEPVLANQDAVRALRPQAFLQLQVLRWSNSLQRNVQAHFGASLSLAGGRSVWEARFVMNGTEQGESILVAQLMKKLIDDRIIDKDAPEPDDTPAARRI